MFYMLILYHRFIYLFFTVLRKYAVCKQTYPKESFSARRKYLQQLIITQEFFVELHGNIHLFFAVDSVHFMLFIWGFQWSMQCYSTSQIALIL